MRWFTSDLHIGHANILHLGEGRPFRDLAHMHSTILKNFWEVVQPEDELWLLGDLALGNFDESIKVLSALPGQKFMVKGNHDKNFPKLNNPTRIERYNKLYEAAGLTVIEELWPLLTIDVAGEPLEVRLTHVPSSPERYAQRSDKLAFARPADDGKFLIHGHTHSKDKASENPRELHVGVDANDFTPVSEIEIAERIQAVRAAENLKKGKRR